ncbi:hypothetical protein GGF32_003581 [Allomyces javanicus]|nr:hypothetical protein GGF32_003581 [Allomyces javanicus]
MALITRQAQAISSLSKPSQRARDGALSLAVDTPWEDYLSPAPMCIALLGQLQLVATKRDFSIRESAPTGGFQFIKYPDSLRACLVQVTNGGLRAFNKAQTNMMRIKSLSQGMPDQIESVFKILVMGNVMEVQQVLPGVLASVTRDAQESERLAKDVDADFLAIMDLTGELLEACTNQKGLTEKQKQEADAAIAAMMLLRDSIAQQQADQAKRVEELKVATMKAEELFNETVRKMPSGWDMIGMNLVESLGKTLCNGLETAINVGVPLLMASAMGPAGAGMMAGGTILGGITGAAGGSKPPAQQGGQGGGAAPAPAKPQVPVTVDKALDVAEQLFGVVNALSAMDPRTGTLKDAKPNAPGVDPNSAAKGPAFIIGMLTETIRTLAAVPQTEIAVDQQAIGKEALKAAEEVKSIAGQLNVDDATVQKLAEQSKALATRQQAYAALAQMTRSRDLAPTMTPGQFQTIAGSGSNLSAAEMAQANWQRAMEATQSNLKDTTKRYDEQTKDLRALQTRHAELMADMAKINVQTIDMGAIIQVLKQGITALAELRVQWQSLCQFFSNLVNVVLVCSRNVRNLTETAANYANIRLSDGSTLTNLGRDTIFELAIKADAVSRVVALISATYVDVSTKYIMGPVSQLGKIAALDAGKDGAQIQKLQQDLLADMAAAQAGILDMVVNKKQEYKRELNARAAEVDRTLRDVLPAPPQVIKEQVTQAQQAITNDRAEAENAMSQVLAASGLDNFWG